MTEENMTMPAKLPDDFINRMKLLLGEEEWQEFLAGYMHESYKALRLNPWKMSHANISEKDLPFELMPVPWEEYGFYYGNEDRPGRHPFHDAGLYYMQEPSAMSAGALAKAMPGEKVLDLCAAPGGKTTQLAAGMKQEGLLISNEIHPARAKILSSNVERMGLGNVIVTNETPDRLSARFPEFFDLVVVDAPCSGEGMFVKEQEAIPQWSLANVQMCGERQQEILREAVKMVRPGGRMVYSTCTFAPVENEGSIAWILANYPDFHVAKADGFSCFAPGRPEWIPEEFLADLSPERADRIRDEIRSTFRLWPHRLKGEGHYAALLVRDGEEHTDQRTDHQSRAEERNHSKRSGNGKGSTKGRRDTAGSGPDKGVQRELVQFAKQNLDDTVLQLDGKDAFDNFCMFGEHLYRMPMALDLKGLRIVRPGLHIADRKTNRLEPAHALAMSLRPEDVKRVCSLSASDGSAMAYIKGEAISVEDAGDGWTLVTCEGISLGWGKVSGGILKNHYPKGLRRNGS